MQGQQSNDPVISVQMNISFDVIVFLSKKVTAAEFNGQRTPLHVVDKQDFLNTSKES